VTRPQIPMGSQVHFFFIFFSFSRCLKNCRHVASDNSPSPNNHNNNQSINQSIDHNATRSPVTAAQDFVDRASSLLLRSDGGFLSTECGTERGTESGGTEGPLRPVLFPALVTALVAVLQALGDDAGVLGVARVLADTFQCGACGRCLLWGSRAFF
jgi:hypothetical protein